MTSTTPALFFKTIRALDLLFAAILVVAFS